jgi:pathogenesis-related protein 1
MLTKVFMLAMAVALFTPASVLDSAQQAEMVSAHNQWRKEVGAPPLKWSANLASTAQAWADQLQKSHGCKMVHSGSSGLGENLYWASPERFSSGKSEEQTLSPKDVVNSWAEERKDYTYSTNSCAPGKVCGHYTQVVWSKTTEVGCGKAICSDKSQVWVCNYKPPGNIIGQKPY